MKTLFILFAAALLFIMGCGKDGEEGKAFLSFESDGYVWWYNDDNSAIPDGDEVIQEDNLGTNYEVSPGNYEYSYGGYYTDYTEWYVDGTYTITVNPGESGGLISDGANGEDNYFTIDLYFPGFQKTNVVKLNKLNTNTIDISLYEKVPVGEVETEIQHSTNGTMVIKRQMYKLILK